MRVGGDLALIDDAILVIVKEFDRILDRKYVVVAFDIDLVDHRSQRRRFTRTGWAGHKDQATGFFTKVGNDRRKTEGVEGFDLVRDRSKHRTDRTFLVKEVGTE